LSDLQRDPVLYPNFDAELVAAMQGETRAFLDHVIWEGNGDFKELFTANYSLMNAKVAELYSAEASSASFEKTSFPNKDRAGLLNQLSFLTSQSGFQTGSIIHRGLVVRERLLCEQLASPPPDAVSMRDEGDPSEIGGF